MTGHDDCHLFPDDHTEEDHMTGKGRRDVIREDNDRERDIARHPARPSGGPFDLPPRIVKAHGGLTGRTGTPCSYCDAEDHSFVDCAQAAAFGRGDKPIIARCGRSDPHGGHVFLETYGPRNGRGAFCAGNVNVIEGQE